MSLEAEILRETRRHRRRAWRWRLVALLAIAGLIWVMLPADLDPVPTAHVARLDHAAIARVAATRPVVATMGATAASAGYMVALPAHRIVARESTLTGSVGVILQSFDASELIARLGVRPETIASGVLKDQPSPFRPLSPEGRAALEQTVLDMHNQFIAMVMAGRNMTEAEVRPLADGRVMTGRRARDAGLFDALGGEREAREWLAETREVPMALPVRPIETRALIDRWIATGTESIIRVALAEWWGQGGLRAAIYR
jgi:protease IV